MDKDQENLNFKSNSEVPPEDSSTEANKPPHEEDSFESEQAIESNKVDSANEDPSVEKIPPGRKGWLLFLVLLITLSTGFYFYTQKKGAYIATTLPWDLKQSFSAMSKIPSPPDTQSKEMPIGPTEKIVEQTVRTGPSEEMIFENEKAINLLRDQIQSLESELNRKNSRPLSQNFQNERLHVNDGILEEETEEIIQNDEEESAPETDTSLIASSSVKIEPPIQQNRIQKTSPERSKEVQAYLDFVENTGSKLVKLIEEGWNRLQALIL